MFDGVDKVLKKSMNALEQQEQMMSEKANRVMMHINTKIDDKTEMQFVFNMWDDPQVLVNNMERFLKIKDMWQEIKNDRERRGGRE